MSKRVAEADAGHAVEMVELVALKPHPRNYRAHPDDQLEHLMQSIREHGFYRNIVLARENTILAGHGVVLAALKMGKEQGPAIRLDLDPNEPRALKVLAADNEIGHLIEVDDRALSELLKEIKDFDTNGLLGTGYDEMMLANLVMVTRPESEIQSFDEAAAWAGLPAYTPTDNPLELVCKFRDKAARDQFVALLGLSLSDSQRSLWWPAESRDDVASVRVASA